MNPTKPLPCSCCHRPFAALSRDSNGRVILIIRARHDHTQHINVLRLEDIKRILEAMEREAQDYRQSAT